MIKLELFTPKGEIFNSDQVKSVTLPSTSGVISIYDNHQPLISLLSYGEIHIEKSNGESEYIFITSGVIRVDRESRVSIMADTSEFSSEIDLDAAILAKQRAEEVLKSSDDLSEFEFTKLQTDIERELTKIELGRIRKASSASVKVNVTKK